MRRTSLVALGVLLGVAILSAVLYFFWLDWTYAHAFSVMVVGSSEADIRKLAGSPSYVTDGTRWVEPRFPKDESQLVKGCVKELWYAMPWPIPQRYSYCFDKSGALVHKYNWVSW
jgi:hypothetical protein